LASLFLRLSPLHFLGFVSFLNNLSLLFSEGGFRFFFETTWLRFFVKVEPLTFFCFVSFLKQFGSQWAGVACETPHGSYSCV
jgi:hypothetical protein